VEVGFGEGGRGEEVVGSLEEEERYFEMGEVPNVDHAVVRRIPDGVFAGDAKGLSAEQWAGITLGARCEASWSPDDTDRNIGLECIFDGIEARLDRKRVKVRPVRQETRKFRDCTVS
jgi:hypothetical protein